MNLPNETSLSAPALPDLAAEATPGMADLAVTLVLIAAAGYYLYRRLWRSRGRCDACDAKGKSCIAPPPGGRGEAKTGPEQVGGRH